VVTVEVADFNACSVKSFNVLLRNQSVSAILRHPIRDIRFSESKYSPYSIGILRAYPLDYGSLVKTRLVIH